MQVFQVLRGTTMLIFPLLALLIIPPDLPVHSPLQIQNIEAVSLEVLFDGVPEYGGGWILTITLEANEDLEKAEIWVEKSKGLSIKSGSPFWHGVLKSGEESVIELSFTLTSPPPQDITVNLVGRTSAGKRFKKKIHRSIRFAIRQL